MLPTHFDLATYPTSDTIRLLASLLERMTLANDLLNQPQQPKRASLPTQAPVYTRFHARLIPSIDIHSYLSRILKYCPSANECFLSLLVYFDRMSKNALAITGKPFTIDSYNIHRLVIAGVMVASKFFSDVFYTNTRYAKVGGLPVTELNNLELEFLKLNNFNLTVSISELQKYGDQLLKVGYMTQESRKPFRHTRSTSFDQSRHDIERICDLTQRMSFEDKTQKKPNVRRMTSTSSLKENNPYGQTYYKPRHSRSSINLHQGFWKPSSPLQQTDSETSSSSSYRRLSLTSIYAPPFIPNSDSYPPQPSPQQPSPHAANYYYYPVGIPTPPPSASPVYYQTSSYSSMYLP